MTQSPLRTPAGWSRQLSVTTAHDRTHVLPPSHQDEDF